MKKVFMIALAILISVAFVTTVFAQAPKDAPKPPAVDKPAKAEKAQKPAKVKAKTFTGEVVKADAAAFVAKDKKGEMTFDVSGVKGYKAENYAAGDKVLVKYAEKDGKMMASAIKKAKAPAKKEKKEMKEKKEAPAKAEPATPAAPPAKK
ncbi:MAG: hypothetical protein PHU49_12015 [Syntrophorhabdaceae bacterium]|nr:hypothetical protein [Syntrophorhabdaceae bacterium]MDD5244732.1 hypothetical protein [Syntrophorhabdaceae bacterium]